MSISGLCKNGSQTIGEVASNGIFCATIGKVIEVRQYIDRLGRNAFERWFERLDGGARARITVSLERVEAGNFSAAKSIGSIFEFRLDFGPGYRIYFGKDGDALVILLAGGTKHRQQNDIEKARALWREYKQRKREG
jgi:putative addiction module killer protein